jgi:hypothetical protein
VRNIIVVSLLFAPNFIRDVRCCRNLIHGDLFRAGAGRYFLSEIVVSMLVVSGLEGLIYSCISIQNKRVMYSQNYPSHCVCIGIQTYEGKID